MTQLWSNGEAILVTLDANGMPTQFIWEEQRYIVQQILQSWELETQWWRPEMHPD